MEGEEESERWPQLPPPSSPASAVISDEDLLGEILLRLESHGHLVAAAIVCKHWLRVASGELFLRRFRVIHPPRLLGFCIDDDGGGDAGRRPQFKALPQHPGVAAAAAAHRTKHRFFGAYGHLAADYHRRPTIADCHDGRLLVVESPDRAPRRLGINTPYRYTVLRPPHPRESVQLLPLLPPPPPGGGARKHVVERVFLPEDGGGAGGDHGITLVYVLLVKRRVTARVHVLDSRGAWGAPTTAETELPAPAEAPWCEDEAVETVLPPINGEVYVVTTSGYTLGLRLGTTRFSVVELPDAARSSTNFRMSWSHAAAADDDDVTRGRLSLVHGDGTRLSVWHRKTTTTEDDGGAAGVGWRLADTFCVREACERIEWLPDGWWTGRVTVVAVGDNAEFALLDLEKVGVVIYVHLRWRTVKKVYERKLADADADGGGGGGGDRRPVRVRVFPLTTVWPPTFPALNKPRQNCCVRSPDGLVGAVVMSCHAGWSATSPSCHRDGEDDDDEDVGGVLPGCSWAGWFDDMAAMVVQLAEWAAKPRSPRRWRWSCL
uniref:F-box protein AT5G49610-like beta-propeller domain-containing protein n=1 Tax=Oryza glumipatula TaxID=40148 RepID=A0A0D9ZIW3_9ORYZ